MATTVVTNKWGGGVGVRIPKSFRESLGIQAGDSVEMSLRGDEIVVRKAAEPNSIEALLRDWQGGRYSEPEVDWGEPTGKELW